MAAVPAERAIALFSSPGIKCSPLRQPPGALPLPGRLSLASLPGFRGLKVQTRSKLSVISITGRNNCRVSQRSTGSIVSEALEETAVDIPSVTDETWQSLVLKADSPVLVEFWAPWCGPCRMAHPVIAELSEEYAGKLKFFKLNTDESPSIATQYGIRSIPTVMMFANGEKRDAIIGAVPKTTLITAIEKLL